MEPNSSDNIIKRDRKQNRKSPIEEQTDYFLDIAEKMMNITLRISGLVEQSMRNINNRVANVQNQINGLEARMQGTNDLNEEDR